MQSLPQCVAATIGYQLVLTDKKGDHHFCSTDIVRLQANDNYTVIYFQTRRPFVVSKVLKIYELLLRPYGFLRTHRSHLVNRSFIEKVEGKKVLMQDASVVEIANKKRTEVMRVLRGVGASVTV